MIRRLLLLAGLALVFQEPKTEEDHEFEMRNGWHVRAPEPTPLALVGWLLALVLLLAFAFVLALIVEAAPRA